MEVRQYGKETNRSDNCIENRLAIPTMKALCFFHVWFYTMMEIAMFRRNFLFATLVLGVSSFLVSSTIAQGPGGGPGGGPTVTIDPFTITAADATAEVDENGNATGLYEVLVVAGGDVTNNSGGKILVRFKITYEQEVAPGNWQPIAGGGNGVSTITQNNATTVAHIGVGSFSNEIMDPTTQTLRAKVQPQYKKTTGGLWTNFGTAKTKKF